MCSLSLSLSLSLPSRCVEQNERKMARIVVHGRKKGKGFASKGQKRASAKSNREKVRVWGNKGWYNRQKPKNRGEKKKVSPEKGTLCVGFV